MTISVISTPSTSFTIPPNQALVVENLGPGYVHWGRFAVDDSHNEGIIQPSNTITFFAPFGPVIYLACDTPTSVNTSFIPFPQSAAMLGTDGTLGGPNGSPLSPSVVSVASLPTGVAATDTANLIAAAARGGTVLLADGTYNLSGTSPVISGIPSGTTFKSIGRRTTIDISGITAASGKKIGFRAQGSLGTKYSLTVDATQQTFSATVSAGNAASLVAAGCGVGSFVMVMTQGVYYPMTAEGSMNRGEIKRVRSINAGAGVVTFDEGLYDSYTVANGAQIALISPVSGVRFEGITFVGSNTEGAGEEPIQFIFVDDWAIEECEFNGVDLIGFEMTSSTNGTISNCKGRGTFYDGVTGVDFYMLCALNATQWVDIVNCEGDQFRHVYTNGCYADAGAGSTYQFGQPRFINLDNCGMKNAQANANGRSYAFEHHGLGEEIQYSNCWADSCDTGMVIKGNGKLTMTNFRVTNWYNGAVLFQADVTDVRDTLIDGVYASAPNPGGTNPSIIQWQTANNATVENVKIKNVLAECDFSNVYAFHCLSTGVTCENFAVEDWQLLHNGTDPLGTLAAPMYFGPMSGVRARNIKGYNMQALIYGSGNNCIADACELENANTASAGFGVRWNGGTNCQVRNCDLHTFVPVRFDPGGTGRVTRCALWADSGSITTGVQDATTGSVILQAFNVYSPDGVNWSNAGTAGFAGLDAIAGGNVESMPRHVVAGTIGTLVSGTSYWAAALVRATQSYSQITFQTGTTAPGGTYTDCRAGVTDASGNILAQTANAVATVTAASTVYTVSFQTPVTLQAGAIVYVGVSFIATTMPTIRGVSILSGSTTIGTKLGAAHAGALTTGNPLGNQGSPNGSTAIPWAVLS